MKLVDLSKVDYSLQCGWALSNLLKTLIEQRLTLLSTKEFWQQNCLLALTCNIHCSWAFSLLAHPADFRLGSLDNHVNQSLNISR